MAMVRRHKDNAHYKTLKVDGYAALVRKALSDKDKYDESLEITIHMLACCLSRYAQIQTELDNEQIRKYLRELRLTKTGASAESEDAGTNELGKLFETINGGANAGPRLLKKSVTK
jgi:S-adenosylmethionine synthetase